MTLSFGEIESLSLKAARGAGLSWGLAEEAGKAVRWLSEHGLPGPEALAAHLPVIAATEYAQLKPVLDSAHWRPAGEALCPLITGVALSDQAATLPDDLTIGPLRTPLLMIPFVSYAAGLKGQALAMDWPDTRIVCSHNAIGISGNLSITIAQAVSITPADRRPEEKPAAPRRAIDPAVLAQLKIFAHRTYVPASEASRLAGAGAQSSDNE